jgi:N-acetylglucosaminyldiphosphoundecaprenol N-acetyl-beta-D-mannosaminyltransferase
MAEFLVFDLPLLFLLSIMVINISKTSEVEVLGTRFHSVTCCDLINYILDSAKKNKKTVIGNVNVRAMNFSYDLKWYRDFINNSDLVFCDGFGVLLASRLYGYSLESKHRMTCPDYIENLAKSLARESISIYLLAGRPGIVDQAIKMLSEIAPDLKIDGHHGFFSKEGEENDFVLQKINDFKPDVLYVGFGMPLQERWILDNMEKIDARVFLPLGACLDFYTGSVYRGPKWMTNSGLEWLSRLLTEPGRLWSRYLIGNLIFMFRVLKEIVAKP